MTQVRVAVRVIFVFLLPNLVPRVSLLCLPTLRAVGFSYAKRERNHCEQPSAFPSSMHEFVTPHVMHLMPKFICQ